MEQSPHRLRAMAALVAGIAAVAVVAVVGMIFGESAVDATPDAIELAVLVIPVTIAAAIVGFVVGYLWRLWFPTSRTTAEMKRCSDDLAAAHAMIAKLETSGAIVADEVAESDPSDATTAPAPPETAHEVTPAPESDAEIAPALTMDDVPTIEIAQEEAAAQVTERFAASKGDAADDLKMIKGVGPVLERLLNDMNVRTFAQVASFTGQDIAVVSAALDAFADRIVRDNWVGQAKDLHERTHG